MNPKSPTPQIAELSVKAVSRMKMNAERTVNFCIESLKDVLGSDEGNISYMVKAYAEAIYVNDKLADYLDKLSESRPIITTKKTKIKKYVLDIQDIFMIEALVNTKMALADAFPAMTGGRSLGIH